MPEATENTGINNYPIDVEYWHSLQGQEITLPWGKLEITATVETVISVNERHGNPIYDFDYHIVLLKLGPPPEGSSIDPEEWASMDANIWILPERNEFNVNAATRVQKVINPEVLFMLQVLDGKGYYLTTGIDGLPKTIELDSESATKPLYANRGSIVTLIAGPDGMLVLGLNYPAFDASFETQHTESGPKDKELYASEKNPGKLIWRTKSKFWDEFRRLRIFK